MNTPEATHVSSDTRIVLLLCGNHPRSPSCTAKPLSPAQWDSVSRWLAQRKQPLTSLIESVDGPFPSRDTYFPDPDRLRALLQDTQSLEDVLPRWLGQCVWILSQKDPDYPIRMRQRLGRISPPLLFGAGRRAAMQEGGLAVVGSRVIDAEVADFTRRVGERCAETGCSVVSGGAQGVDQEATLAALAAGGTAVSVLPARLDRYGQDPELRNYVQAERLTIVSPYTPETGFHGGLMLGRNKCIYALADASLIVRFTTGKGGTWRGAVEQLKRNGQHPGGPPVFVRVAHNPLEGWQSLQRLGALPWDSHSFLGPPPDAGHEDA